MTNPYEHSLFGLALHPCSFLWSQVTVGTMISPGSCWREAHSAGGSCCLYAYPPARCHFPPWLLWRHSSCDNLQLVNFFKSLIWLFNMSLAVCTWTQRSWSQSVWEERNIHRGGGWKGFPLSLLLASPRLVDCLLIKDGWDFWTPSPFR